MRRLESGGAITELDVVEVAKRATWTIDLRQTDTLSPASMSGKAMMTALQEQASATANPTPQFSASACRSQGTEATTRDPQVRHVLQARPLPADQPCRAAVPIVVVQAESAADGRVFSMPSQLRRLGWDGHIHAAGALLPDQLGMLFRCGYDAVLIGADRWDRYGAAHWQQALAQSAQLQYVQRGVAPISIWRARGLSGGAQAQPDSG